ncbi:hypothetical protein TCAL_08857 [Tigriopus californicus]|uniref:C1q domain-containing protein n=1 Tax=Tigriopus californicus TaxID=6832 RepID=A0A553PTI9_TIGCA|nr:hypothetical protein TCAL_08857 [Tigriopus californicus]
MYPIVPFTVLYVMIISQVMSVGHYAKVVPGSKPRSAEEYLQQIYIHPTTSLPPISRPINVCNECERRFILVQHQMEYAFAQLERLSDENRKLQDHITNLGVAILERAAMALKETRDADYSHLMRRINRLENKIAGISKADNVPHQTDIITDKLDQLDEIEQKLSQVATFQQNLNRLTEKVTVLEEDKRAEEDISPSLNDVKTLLDSAQSDINSLNNTVTQTQNRIFVNFDVINMRIDNVTSRVELLANSNEITAFESLESRIETLATRLDDIEVVPQGLPAINNKLTMLEKGVVDLATNVSSWRQDLISEDGQLSRDIEGNEKEIKDLSDKQEALLNQVLSLETKTSGQSDLSVTMVKQDILQLQGNLSTWQIELDKQELKIERNANEVETLKAGKASDLIALNSRITTVKDDLKVQLTELVTLKENVTNLKENIQGIQTKITDVDLDSCCSADDYEIPTLPDYSEGDQTAGATARADEIKTDIIFCGENSSYQRNRYQPLVFEKVRLQGTKLLDMETGIFQVPANGKYLFSIYLNTRSCGSLSLCGATVVQLWKNEESMREFKIGSASDRRNDLESISGVTFLELTKGDSISLQMSETIFDGVNNLEFCGVKLN